MSDKSANPLTDEWAACASNRSIGQVIANAINDGCTISIEPHENGCAMRCFRDGQSKEAEHHGISCGLNAEQIERCLRNIPKISKP